MMEEQTRELLTSRYDLDVIEGRNRILERARVRGFTVPQDLQQLRTSLRSRSRRTEEDSLLIMETLQGTIRELEGFGVRAEDGRMEQHLLFASSRGFVPIAKSLIQVDVNLDARGESGMTPAHAAAERCHRDIVEALIEAGCDVNARDNAGQTPLHRAVYVGSEEMVRLLLDAGADPSIRDNARRTALRLAEEGNGGRTQVAAILRASGAVS